MAKADGTNVSPVDMKLEVVLIGDTDVDHQEIATRLPGRESEK